MPDDNIIPFQPRPKKNEETIPPKRHPPMLNIPPVTKILTGLILATYLILFSLSMTIFPEADKFTAFMYGFTPAIWTSFENFQWWTPLTLISFSFLHGGWLHLGVNIVLLVAMGSGLEKTIGIKNYLIIYIGATVIAILTHLVLYPTSFMPVIGASGGVNGIFGAMIYLMNKDSTLSDLKSNKRLLGVVALYIGITIFAGLLGGPDGSSVAWVAHIGGFLGGIGIMMVLLKRQKI
jgi:membrane associated rhomboid family serine protease